MNILGANLKTIGVLNVWAQSGELKEMVELNVSMFCLLTCRNEKLRNAAAQIKVVRPFLSQCGLCQVSEDFGRKLQKLQMGNSCLRLVPLSAALCNNTQLFFGESTV